VSSVLYSVIESPAHPNLSALYRRLGIAEIKFNSVRKAISTLKKQPPDWVVADFSYGYANNYAGVNVSNLDVLLASLRRYAPQARVIVLAEQREYQYVDKLRALFAVHAALVYPVREEAVQQLLSAAGDGATGA
jgi:DNA-binding NarL/FixJ family response regulator